MAYDNAYKYTRAKCEPGDDTVSQECDPDNPLPYGGTTDIHGNIIKAITKEEQYAMLAKVRRAFGKKR